MTQQNRPWQKLYGTKRWKKIREHQLTFHPLCQWHLKRTPPELVRASVVHHVHAHKGDEFLFYRGPFESLCKPCHDSHAQQDERHGYSLEIGEDGWPIDHRHPANKPTTPTGGA